MWFKNVVKFVRSVIKMAHEKVYGICENKCAVEVEPKKDSGWITIAEAEAYDGRQGIIRIAEPIQCRRIGQLIYFRGEFDVLGADKRLTRTFYLPEEIKNLISEVYQFYGNSPNYNNTDIRSFSTICVNSNKEGKIVLYENITQSGANNSSSNHTWINFVVPVDE